MLATGAVFAAATGASVTDKKKPLTKAAFIKKADQICSDTNDELRPLIEEHFGDLGPGEEPDADALAAFAEGFIPIAQQGHNDIEKLREPKADKEKIEALLDKQQAAIDAAEEDPQSLLNSEDFLEVRELAKAYGFKVCGAG